MIARIVGSVKVFINGRTNGIQLRNVAQLYIQMTELTLFRFKHSEDSVIGSLSIHTDKAEEFICYTLEDRVREMAGKSVNQWKIPGQTAIPAGRYELKKTWSIRFKKYTLQLMDVPGFSGIRIHAGNTNLDTEGCILPGTGISDKSINGSQAIVRSREALAKVENRVYPLLQAGEQVFIRVG